MEYKSAWQVVQLTTEAQAIQVTPRRYAADMSDSRKRKIVTAAEMDAMSPQERAAAVESGVLHDWNEVEPEFRRVVEEKARQIAATLRSDA